MDFSRVSCVSVMNGFQIDDLLARTPTLGFAAKTLSHQRYKLNTHPNYPPFPPQFSHNKFLIRKLSGSALFIFFETSYHQGSGSNNEGFLSRDNPGKIVVQLKPIVNQCQQTALRTRQRNKRATEQYVL